MQIDASGGGGSASGGGGGGGCIYLGYEDSSTINTSMVNVVGGTGVNNGSNGIKQVFQLPLRPASFTVTDGLYNGTSLSGHNFSWTSGGGLGTEYHLEVSLDGGYEYTDLHTTSSVYTFFAGSGSFPVPAGNYYYRIASATSTFFPSSFLYSGVVPLRAVSGISSSTISARTATSVNLVPQRLPNATSSLLNLGITVSSTNGTTPLNTSINQYGTAAANGSLFAYDSWGGSIGGLSPSTTYDFYVRWAFSTTTPSPYIYAAQTTTLLATPATPSITSESTSTIGLTWSQNGNPSTTPYAVYNVTLGQYHLADGTLSATPTFYPLSSWNGKAKGLTPATLYTFKIVLRNENGTQYATSTNAGGTYTFNANGTPISLGGSPSTVGSTTTNTTSTVSGGTSWYFGTPGSTTTMTTASQPTTTQPTTNTATPSYTTGGTSYYLPDGTLITPQLIFQMMNASYGTTPSNLPSISLYKGKNLSSNILFSRFSTQANPLLVGRTLTFRYTYQNPNKTGLYRIERVLLNPRGTVVARSVVPSRTITFGQTITYNPSQYFSRFRLLCFHKGDRCFFW
jgi:hypothetical protein